MKLPDNMAISKCRMALSPSASYKSQYQHFTPPFDIPTSWQWVRIADISSDILYGVSESAKTEGSYKLLRITDIQNSGVSWDSVPYTEYDPNKVNQFILQNGDILFARTGATVGKSYLVENVPTNAIYASYLIRIRTVREVLPEYLKLFFESGFYWTQITLGSVGIGQPNVNGTSLGQLILPIPPRNEQIRILSATSRILDTISDISASSHYLLDLISVVKSKILDLAMQGKLVPQDPSDEPAADMLLRINPKAKIITDNPHYPQLPDNWVLTKLGDVVKVINGKSQKEVENPSGAYPIYGSGGVIGKADAYSCLSGSTIIGRKGTINNPQFIETNFWNVDTAFGMKPCEAVNDLYFYYFCKSFDFTSLDKSSTLPSLTKTAIEGILMPIPPLGEQRRIILKIKEYDELFRNIFTQIGQK